jgi:hypothetical protein
VHRRAIVLAGLCALALVPLRPVVSGAVGPDALAFDGVDDHVSFGDPAALDLRGFTLEAWVRWDGPGVAISTGRGGVPDAVPILTHGVAQSEANRDGSTLDMNWFLGVDASSGVLVADMEEGAGAPAPGKNHPVSGSTVVTDGAWHHVAATYDGVTWGLFVDGRSDASLVVNRPVRFDSKQHAGLAAALTSSGARRGALRGALDEVRVWNRARTADEIATGMPQAIPSADGLVARWALDEGTGTTIGDGVGVAHGVLKKGGTWVEGVALVPPPPPNAPPDAPTLVEPADGAIDVPTSTSLAVGVSDPEGDAVDVTFHAAPVAAEPPPDPFTVVAIPDTQHYVDSPDREATFGQQTRWIVDTREQLDTVFVTHLGDVVQNVDSKLVEWTRADTHMAVLDANGVPNNLAPGNHDMSSTGQATLYDATFPPSRYEANEWYGGYLGDTTDAVDESLDRLNKDNYELFEVGTLRFLIIHIEYDMPAYAVEWAQRVIDAHPDRRVIISTHLFLNASGNRPSKVLNRPDGMSAEAVWQQLVFPNCSIFLVVNGHYSGEGRRVDDNACGDPVHQVNSDYQNRANGGNGWLRYMTFEPAENEIEVFTYSPKLGKFETDANSRFTLGYDMGGAPVPEVGAVTGVASGTTAWLPVEGFEPGTTYAWYAVASGPAGSVVSPTWTFTTQAPAA